MEQTSGCSLRLDVLFVLVLYHLGIVVHPPGIVHNACVKAVGQGALGARQGGLRILCLTTSEAERNLMMVEPGCVRPMTRRSIKCKLSRRQLRGSQMRCANKAPAHMRIMLSHMWRQTDFVCGCAGVHHNVVAPCCGLPSTLSRQ